MATVREVVRVLSEPGINPDAELYWRGPEGAVLDIVTKLDGGGAEATDTEYALGTQGA